MIALIYISLSLLIAIEATTSIARKAGYLVGTPVTGLFLQSSMAFLSRIVVFMFMPLIGYMADSNKIESTRIHTYLFLLLVITILGVCKFKNILLIFSIYIINGINEHGSLFKGTTKRNIIKANRRRIIKKLNLFYFMTLASYVPYYLAWPIVIMLLGEYHENRGLVLGLASIFNGISTIILTIFIDPMLAKLGKKKRLILAIYDDLLIARGIAVVFSFVIISAVNY